MSRWHGAHDHISHGKLLFFLLVASCLQNHAVWKGKAMQDPETPILLSTFSHQRSVRVASLCNTLPVLYSFGE